MVVSRKTKATAKPKKPQAPKKNPAAVALGKIMWQRMKDPKQRSEYMKRVAAGNTSETQAARARAVSPEVRRARALKAARTKAANKRKREREAQAAAIAAPPTPTA